MKPDIELRGVDEMRNAFMQRAKFDMVKKVVSYHTSDLQKKAKQKAPVDTGFLKRSIVTESADNGMTGIIRAYAEYAGYVELGTRFMSAQPYMFPAFNEVKHPFLKDLMRIKEA